MIKFNDKEDSNKVFIYLIGGTLTKDMHIERLTISLYQGSFIIDSAWELL